MNQKHAHKHPKICFIALTAYPMLSRKNIGHVIGPDVHSVLLGRELLKQGFDVSFITYDEGGLSRETIDGIQVLKTYSFTNRPNSVMKAIHLWKAMREIGASVYYQQGTAGGVSALFCQLSRKRFVLGIGSDAHVVRGIGEMPLLLKLGSKLDIRLADVVICQSEFQSTMLKQNFGRDGQVIKNHFRLNDRKTALKAKPPIVLWVGAVAEVKQPELFLKLAEVIPHTVFRMIAARGDSDDYYRKIKETSKNIPNLDFLGFIPFDETNQYFEVASIIVNTSKFEGFPYAFIQAWMNYTPVVTLNSDPDEIICRYRLGLHSKTFNQLVEDVRALLEDEPLRRQMGENGRQYVEENHDINNIIKQYIEVFDQLAEFR
jgi:glycosyltransferase involved in cell wall biosynthesis